MQMEKTNAEMSTTRDNQFFGDIAQEENSKKECAMMGLIKNQIIVLNEELDVAYNRLGQVATDEENWSVNDIATSFHALPTTLVKQTKINANLKKPCEITLIVFAYFHIAAQKFPAASAKMTKRWGSALFPTHSAPGLGSRGGAWHINFCLFHCVEHLGHLGAGDIALGQQLAAGAVDDALLHHGR